MCFYSFLHGLFIMFWSSVDAVRHYFHRHIHRHQTVVSGWSSALALHILHAFVVSVATSTIWTHIFPSWFGCLWTQLDHISYIIIYYFVVFALAVVRLDIAQVCGLCSCLSLLIRQVCMMPFLPWWLSDYMFLIPYQCIGLLKLMIKIPMNL